MNVRDNPPYATDSEERIACSGCVIAVLVVLAFALSWHFINR